MHPADPRVALLRDQLVGRQLRGTEGVRFYLRELIGEGGQGWVYRGNYDEPDGVPIVVKVLRPDGVTEETLRRFRREAGVLRQLGAQANPNPNLVRFFDHGAVWMSPPNSSPHDQIELTFTVMEYVHGSTLAQIIQDHPTGLGAHRTRRLLRQVAFALSSVHAQSVTHRDLKPSNILVSNEQETEVVKVTDFGLAKLVEVGVQRTQMLAGATLGYAPPEQFEKGNDRVGPRTDVFSLAAILFECLTGTQAFGQKSGETAIRSLERLMTGPRPSLTRVVHTLTAELRNPALLLRLDAELARATQPEPGERHASIREFWDAVEPSLRVASASVSSLPPREAPIQVRVQESIQPAGEPSATMPRFTRIGALPRPDVLSFAVWSRDGRTAFAKGTAGLYRWSGGAWATLAPPSWVDLTGIRGLGFLPDGAPLLYGDRASVIVLTANGGAERWRLPEDDLQLLGAHVERTGLVLVGGRHSRPRAVCVEASFGMAPRIRGLDDCATLHDVTRLDDGNLIACGDDGALVRLDANGHAVIPWGRTGHLLAIAARHEGGAFAVGTGGHALSISRELQATLEPVQTTRDLLGVTTTGERSTWACSTHRRILQRRGTTWVRVPLDVDMDEGTSILAVAPIDGGVTAIAADGQVLEGRFIT